MPTLEWSPGGESVVIQSGVARAMRFTEHAEDNDGRYFGIIKHGEGPCDVILAVDQTLKLGAECRSADTAKQVAQAWARMAITVDDRTVEVLMPHDADGDQRVSLARIELDRIHSGQTTRWQDDRVSALGRPGPPSGYSYYVVAFKTSQRPNIFAGGTHVYP
jgi:hypothetical protein